MPTAHTGGIGVDTSNQGQSAAQEGQQGLHEQTSGGFGGGGAAPALPAPQSSQGALPSPEPWSNPSDVEEALRARASADARRARDAGIIADTLKKQQEQRASSLVPKVDNKQSNKQRSNKSQPNEALKSELDPSFALALRSERALALRPEQVASQIISDQQKSSKKKRQSEKRRRVSDYYKDQAAAARRNAPKKKKTKIKNPAKDTIGKEKLGPAVPVNSQGVVASGPVAVGSFTEDGQFVPEGQQPVTAIVKANLGNSTIVPKRIADAWKKAEEAAEGEGSSETPINLWKNGPSQPLLPGPVGRRSYRAYRTDRKDKRSDDEIIADTMRAQAESLDLENIYPNMVDISVDDLTLEEYEEDYINGNRDDEKYKTRKSDAEKHANKTANEFLKFYDEAYVPVESQKVEKDGRIVSDLDGDIARFMSYFGLAPEERDIVEQMVIQYLGFFPDSKGAFFNDSENNRPKLSDEVYREALNCMIVSDKLEKHPFAMVNRGIVVGGTRCYPLGVMTKEMAEILCSTGHHYSYITPLELMSRCANTFVNETYLDMKKNAPDNQRYVYENAIRALCYRTGISPKKFGVSEFFDRGYEEMLADQYYLSGEAKTEDEIKANAIRKKQIDLAKARYLRSENRLDRKRNRTYQVYTEDIYDMQTGELLHQRGDKVKKKDNADPTKVKDIRNSKSNAFNSACMSVANTAKFMGVVGYVPIMASGIVEHAQGNVNVIIANRILFGKNDEYKPNNAMYAHMTSEAGIEGIAAWKALLHVGGQDALIMFYKNYSVLNKENALAFLRDYVKQEGSDNALAKKARSLNAKMEEATRWLMPGDIGFGASDAKRWLEGFMINNMFNAKDDRALEQSFTSEQVLEMMESMGVERFLAAATEMNAGRDAMIMAKNQTLDRTNPLSHTIDSILRSNGLTNMIFTIGIDTYFTYGLNLIQMMIPFSNTFSYLAVKFGNGIYHAAESLTSGSTQNQSLDLDILNYQLGGNDAFWKGFYKNVIYDLVKLGNITLMGGFLAFVIAALGFDEPEDPLNKYVWSEYRIGRNIGLGGKDENGNPVGIPVYAAWWLNDLTMFALPMAYALNASRLEQTLDKNDPDLPWKLFCSGCYDMVTGCSLLDLIKTVNNAERDFRSYEQMMQDPEMNCPPDWFSFALLQAELFTARSINKMVPNAIKSLSTESLIVGENAFDHTPYKVYDRNSTVPGKTQNVNDWFELQRRIESRYNPIYALYNNLTKNGYLFDNGTTEKTGYLFHEMPISTAKDPLRAYWSNRYDYDPDNIPGGEANRIAYTEECIEKVLADIDSFNSVEEARNQGYMIPAALRYRMRDYCYQHINFEENLYNQRVQQGYYANSAEKSDGYTTMKNNQSRYYNYLNNWIFNSDIPWSDEGYAKLRTNHYEVFYYKETGSPATRADYYNLGPEVVEQRFLPRGDHPSSLIPFTSPDRRGRGFNYETISNWYRDGESGSDLQKIFEQMQQPQYDADGNLVSEHAVVPTGRDAGVYVNTAVFGGDPNFVTNELIESSEYRAMNEPTMGYRAYVPWDDKFLDDLKNVTRKDVDADSSLGDMGKYIDSSQWKTSSYPDWGYQAWPSGGTRTYYSSGGGSYSSNYNPKIYSNPHSVNSDRASTMYTKTPYTANTSYLRPSFSTKGSREAYRRQDL